MSKYQSQGIFDAQEFLDYLYEKLTEKGYAATDHEANDIVDITLDFLDGLGAKRL